MPYMIDLNKYTGKLGGFLSMVLMSHAGVDNQVDADEIAKLEQAKKRLEELGTQWSSSNWFGCPSVFDTFFFQQSTGLWNMFQLLLKQLLLKPSIHKHMEFPGPTPRIRARRAALEQAKAVPPPAPALPATGLAFIWISKFFYSCHI